jgi:hypothetical protein
MGLKVWLIKKGLEGKLPLWCYRLIGNRIRKLLQLEDTNMADISKPWWKSKAKWAAILAGVFAAVQPITTAFGHPVQIPLWVYELLAGLGIYGVRDAMPDKPSKD